MRAATSIVDPVPTCLLKACFTCVGTVVLSIVNDSLGSGIVTASFKIASVTSVPKKTITDLDNFNNYHPISNLPFLGRILERIVASQLHTHLNTPGICVWYYRDCIKLVQVLPLRPQEDCLHVWVQVYNWLSQIWDTPGITFVYITHMYVYFPSWSSS